MCVFVWVLYSSLESGIQSNFTKRVSDSVPFGVSHTATHIFTHCPFQLSSTFLELWLLINRVKTFGEKVFRYKTLYMRSKVKEWLFFIFDICNNRTSPILRAPKVFIDQIPNDECIVSASVLRVNNFCSTILKWFKKKRKIVDHLLTT